MDKQVLIESLIVHIATPQAAEHWAKYYLICPVVDFANKESGLVSEFGIRVRAFAAQCSRHVSEGGFRVTR
ncbi:hypothetical protein SAMN05414139_02931 [Burkholderia sp. D7]|nr:hypothetical protein SAMN05414139_02931 [Burkholderia sp. D7]